MEYDTYKYALDRGVLVVCAAGNDGASNDQFDHFPSNQPLPNVLAVGGHDRSDNLYQFTNTGASSVDLGAPAVAVLSSVPIELPAYADHYASFNGTSMNLE